MEIRPGQKIYQRTADKDIFLEWRLVNRDVSMSDLLKKRSILERQIAALKQVVPSEGLSVEQKEAIADYNKRYDGPKELLVANLEAINVLIRLLNALPPYLEGSLPK